MIVHVTNPYTPHTHTPTHTRRVGTETRQIHYFLRKILRNIYYTTLRHSKHSENGPHEANRTKVHWWQSPKEATGNQSSTKRAYASSTWGHWWREETSPIQARDCSTSRDSQVPEEHGLVDTKTTIPEART